MSEDEKCTCKACKNTVFHCQICKFVGFLLPSSSWLLKLPNVGWLTQRKCQLRIIILLWKFDPIISFDTVCSLLHRHSTSVSPVSKPFIRTLQGITVKAVKNSDDNVRILVARILRGGLADNFGEKRAEETYF